jgi:hypothetical protein
MTRFTQFAEEFIDVFNHLKIELLVINIGFLMDFILFNDRLHEVPDLLLHILEIG